jgi:DnaJ family protein A protein 5
MKDEEAISEDKNNFMAPQAKDAIMRCHYEVLELDRSNCTADDVKKQYKKMALKWHPDRNIGQEEDATIRFKEVGAAYAVLSDPHEKKWYDDHRDSILRGSNGRRGNKDDDDVGDCVDLWAFFSSSCYDGMDDSPEGFYTVYAKAFASVVQSENVASEKLLDYPDFGTSTSTHAEVLAFYNQWSNFVSVLSFAWEDEHNPSEAPDRRVRREIEKLNKKNRDAGRKKYMDQISQLVSFVKKRDPRMQAIEELQVAKKAEEAAKKERARADELARRAEEREKYFAKMNDAEEIKRREVRSQCFYIPVCL